MMNITLNCETLNLLGVTRIQHHTTQALQGSPSYPYTSYVLDMLAITLHKTCTSTHRDNNSLRQPTLKAGT